MVQGVGAVDGVAHPVYVSEIVFAAFFKMEVDIDMLVVVLDNGVGSDECIAISPRVHFIDE